MVSDKLLLAVLTAEQMAQTTTHTRMLVMQGVAMSQGRKGISASLSDSDSSEGPGKGHSFTGSKASYARRPSSKLYDTVRNLDPDVTLFEKTVHLSRSEFDALHDLAYEKLQAPMDVRGEFVGETRLPRKRRLDTKEMLFMFLDILGGSNEGGMGIERLGHKYGISKGTVSNYFRHALCAVFKCLEEVIPKLIRCPDELEREAIEGLIIGFPKCVFFVDGNKNRRWRPGENSEQERAYDGYKKAHAFSILVFCDIYGRFIRIEVSDKGAESDRNMYTTSDVFKNSDESLSTGQHGMADMGFAGSGELVVPYKRNESTMWMYRSIYNKCIRKQRMVNEWGIGYVNNRFRLFLGRWPFEKELFSLAYYTVAMLSNWQFDRRGFALQPRSRYEEKLAAQDENDDDDCTE